MDTVMNMVRRKFIIRSWILWIIGLVMWLFSGTLFLMTFGNMRDNTAPKVVIGLIILFHFLFRYHPKQSVTPTENGGWTLHFNQIIYPTVFLIIMLILTW